jgi:hypothetical protein
MKNNDTLECSLKCEIGGVLYNYCVVKTINDKSNGIVELKWIGGKKPKYVDWDTFNNAIAEIKSSLADINKKLD